jgi:hypothetical protein
MEKGLGNGSSDRMPASTKHKALSLNYSKEKKNANLNRNIESK